MNDSDLSRHAVDCKLSICISTLNRAAFIGHALDSIMTQLTDECEVVVSDNASADNTEEVVAERADRFKRLRYVKHGANNGADRNIDRVVGLARGEYCWMFSDDDAMKPGAVSAVLAAIKERFSVILVNMELRDVTLAKVLRPRWINFESDRVYQPTEADRMFAELDGTVVNLCNIVIKRDLWLSRERQRYYGSNFIHTGVMFQKRLPGPALVMATPLICYRDGNSQSFASEWSEIWLSRWPAVVESLGISKAAKKLVETAEPWNSPLWLLMLRGANMYSVAAYRRWVRPKLGATAERILPLLIAVLPHKFAMPVYTLYTSARRVLRCRPRTLFSNPV